MPIGPKKLLEMVESHGLVTDLSERELTFGMKNVSDCVVTFEMGARIAHVQFEYVDGGGEAYRGQWRGGRVAATKREIQE